MDEGKQVREFGVVKAYLPMKGFGFIRRAKGKDVFFLRTDANAEAVLFEGTPVSFVVSQEERGPRAREIQREG
ncbi:retron Se72 family effector protein [Roseateles sp. SL47]|uniref:retron Se72 family effector protein n=1 Tax=Roseateles sp. SL47 TaxID=2995138 RepID=UPI00227063FE|nr:retron Se72 family effector protein [Roseateles sp. SL47]WAC71039.1 retron Se72 family effector protein [Roseateles sp. SL47]